MHLIASTSSVKGNQNSIQYERDANTTQTEHFQYRAWHYQIRVDYIIEADVEFNALAVQLSQCHTKQLSLAAAAAAATAAVRL